jgi:hypothetical protein
MRILIGHEQFGHTREAMRRLGHEAWSCDLQPARDGSKFHIVGDVERYLDDDWDLGIFHPDCTFLTNSAEWAYKDPDYDRYPGVGYHQRLKPGTLFGAERRAARVDAVAHVIRISKAPIKGICIENPTGHLSKAWRKPTQIIHPPQFGDDASKATCLWLIRLAKLRPTGWAEPRMGGLPLFGGDGGPMRWSNQTDNGQNKLTPSDDRAMQRAATYPGISNAMALQWAGQN